MKKADYGLDAPIVVRNLFIFGVLSVLVGIIVLVIFSFGLMVMSIIGGLILFTGICLMITGSLMIFSSKIGKIKQREKLLDILSFRGNENVLDVGCGRGLYLVGAAKRLSSGSVVGIDIWQGEDLLNNSLKNTLANASREGVINKVSINTADMRDIPFENDHFDLVLSCLAIHNIYDVTEREKALLEILRVLKVGGKLCIIDMSHINEYIKVFEHNGVTVQTLRALRLVFPKSTAIIGFKN